LVSIRRSLECLSLSTASSGRQTGKQHSLPAFLSLLMMSSFRHCKATPIDANSNGLLGGSLELQQGNPLNATEQCLMHSWIYAAALASWPSPSMEDGMTEVIDCFWAVSRLGEHIPYTPEVLLTMFGSHCLDTTIGSIGPSESSGECFTVLRANDGLTIS